MSTPVKFARTAPDFAFELDQIVGIRISNEWGQVRGRSQHVNSENKYLIHYKAADKCACSTWFGESELEAVYDDHHPGCPVFAAVELPEGAKVEDCPQ